MSDLKIRDIRAGKANPGQITSERLAHRSILRIHPRRFTGDKPFSLGRSVLV